MQNVGLKTEQQKHLYNILTNKLQPLYSSYDKQIFNIDLVIKMQIPTNRYITKNQQLGLSAFIRNPSLSLTTAYQTAFEELLNDVDPLSQQNKNNNQILIRNFSSLEASDKIMQKVHLWVDDMGNEQQITFNCSNIYNGKVDSFSLKYNALIYTLQHKCGFKLKSFIVNNYQSKKKEIYILIWQSMENMIKVAERHRIKKQIDYEQIDLFFNEPTDSVNRPLIINSIIQKQMQNQQLNNHELPNKTSQGEQKITKQYSNKQISRKLQVITAKDVEVFEQVYPTESQKARFFEFEAQNQRLINQIFNKNDQLSAEQKMFLFQVNRKKINPGCEKVFINIKRQREYFQKMQKLCIQHGFKIRESKEMFAQFILVGKKRKFFDRLKSILFYKEQIVTPYGDFSLFVKSQKIKICYLALTQNVRVQNLLKLGCQVFALNDNFQKFGKVTDQLDQRAIKSTIKGGLNGKNLVDEWHSFIPWKTSVLTLRNYLGQLATYQILIKNHLILHFLVMTPIAVGGEVIERILLQTESASFQFEFWFYVCFFTISIIVFNVFLELWRRKQENFLENYVQKQTYQSFLFDFKGPFIRNLVTDSVNQYSIKPSFQVRIKQLVFNLLIACVLGLEIGFFYGMRILIVTLDSLLQEKTFYIISLSHIIPYFIFFIVNTYAYKIVFAYIFHQMTTWENLSTDDAFRKSFEAKSFLFLIGIQLIGPIDLLIIQAFNGTSCFSSYCYPEFVYYVYSRYVVLFFFVLVKFVMFLKKFVTTQTLQLIDAQKIKITDNNSKFCSLLEFIKLESEKSQVDYGIIDQTLLLFHQGIFVTSFPLSSGLALGGVLCQYFLERLIIINNCKRPISKPQKIAPYSSKYNLVMHMSIIVNSWIIFFTLEDIQYVFQTSIENYQYPPTESSINTMKILLTLFVIILYEVLSYLVRSIVRNSSSNKVKERQKNKYNAYNSMKIYDSYKQKDHEFHKPIPLRTIFRVYNDQEKPFISQSSFVSDMQQDQSQNVQ